MKQLFKSIITNDYFGVATLWFTSILIDTNTGNRMVVNILLIISCLALMRVLLKDLLGIETPYLKPLFKFIKFNRVLEKVNDTDKLYEDMDKDYHRAKEFIIKKGLVFKMKKLLYFIFVANWQTFAGLSATIVLGLDKYYGLTEYYKLPPEWQWTVVAFLFVVVGNAVRGRGFEWIDTFKQVKKLKSEMKDKNAIQKQYEKDMKALAEHERLEKLKQEYRSNAQAPQPPIPPSNVRINR